MIMLGEIDFIDYKRLLQNKIYIKAFKRRLSGGSIYMILNDYAIRYNFML